MDPVGNQHVVPQPKFLFFVRIAQAALAVLAIALAAASLSELGSYAGFSGPLGFMIFVSLSTIIIDAYLILSPIYQPQLYNRWAALGLEIYGVIFWLPAFASVGSQASAANSVTNGINPILNRNPYYDRPDPLSKNSVQGWHIAGAAAGMGGLEFVLFLITLITFSIYVHRHRLSGAPARAGQPFAPSTMGQPMDNVQQHQDTKHPTPQQQAVLYPQ